MQEGVGGGGGGTQHEHEQHTMCDIITGGSVRLYMERVVECGWVGAGQRDAARRVD